MHLKGTCISLTADSTKGTCIHTLHTPMLIMESHATGKGRWCKRSPVQSEISAHPLGIKRMTARVAPCLALLLHPVPVGCALGWGYSPAGALETVAQRGRVWGWLLPTLPPPFSRICFTVRSRSRSRRRVLGNYLTRLPRAQERGTPDAPLWRG